MKDLDTMMCAQFKVNYVGKQSRIIKALFVDLADMEIEISKLSKMPGVESVDLQDYQSVVISPGIVSCEELRCSEDKTPAQVESESCLVKGDWVVDDR